VCIICVDLAEIGVRVDLGGKSVAARAATGGGTVSASGTVAAAMTAATVVTAARAQRLRRE